MSSCDATHRFCIDTHLAIDEAVEEVLARIKARDPDQKEFIQAFVEVLESLKPLFEKDRYYLHVLETCAEPERVFTFRIPWVDDKGCQHVNRGYRVQYSSVLGPYKGGLRLHPSVTLSVVKFLGFEQILKNSLTGLSLGGAKGGSDFDPKGKTHAELLRFCQSFAVSLHDIIGPDRDVPAGDIGVSSREIGYMFGMYKRLTGRFEGVFTGKGVEWGGSLLRTEATGYGVVYFAKHIVEDLGKKLEGARALVSGAGNVAQHCAEKLIEEGAKVLTLSDSKGYILVKDGITQEMIAAVIEIKHVHGGSLKEMTEKFSAEVEYFEGERPWKVEADLAFPCATQNELEEEDAKVLAKNKVWAVVEGANMPCNAEAIKHLEENKIIYGPGKAANAGGVAVSCLEMAQDSQREQWTADKVDGMLHDIMRNIYQKSAAAAAEYGCEGNLRIGANIAGFKRVADAIIAQGSV